MDFFDILLAKKLEDDRDPTIEGLSVTENGTYREEGKAYSPVIVEVPEPTLITKSVTANGTYSASADNADGYSSVTVNVRTDFYGMIIHQAIANPNERIEYIGINTNYRKMTPDFASGKVDYGDWIGMPTIVRNKPAMIKTDGTLDYYLDETDYTKKADGTASDVSNLAYDGNAFAWFPAMWMKIIENGSDLEVRFAYEQLDSDYYEVCPTGSEGVWLPMFYGSPDSSGKMRSIANTSVLGGVTNNTTTDVQNTAIKRNGNDYYFLGGKLLDCITLLQMMWFKTTNSDNICRGNQDGYDSTAANYGTKDNAIVGGGQFYLKNDGTSANKALHCLPLATYDVWLRNPYIICDNGTYKVSKDYTFDSTGATYTNTRKTSPSDNGYQKELTYVDGFGLVPKSVGASTSTYYSDYYYINSSIVAVARSFGYCVSGRVAGFRALNCNFAAGGSDWNYGCALFLKQSR